RPLAAPRAQRVTQALEDLRLVVDEEDPPLHAASSEARSSRRRIVNVVPLPTSLSQVRVPPFRSTPARASDRPCPVPRPTSFVVKKGSKMRFRMSFGIPHPVSLTVITTALSTYRLVTRTRPFSPESPTTSWIAWAALTTRFRKAWLSSLRLQTTAGRSP